MQALEGFSGFGSLCENCAWIEYWSTLKCFIFSKKCWFDSFFVLKAKCSFVLVGTMRLKRTLSDSRADSWPTLFFGEHYALCVRCVIDSTAVAMIYILKISCYDSMVNKQAMTFILLVLSPLVCSGYTFEFS